MTTPHRAPILARYPHQAPIALSVSAHNRIAGRRTDEDWIAEKSANPDTRMLLLHDGQVVVCPPEGSPVWVPPGQKPAGQLILLGEHSGEVRFAVFAENLPEYMSIEPLRTLVQTLDADEAALIVQAVALAQWHRSHRHCPRCGGLLEIAHAGHLQICADCGAQQFPRTDPAVIMVVTDADDRCLLGRHESWPEGRFSTLAGFVEPGESLEQAVAREVEEEVGVVVEAVDYFGNQPWPFPASLMVGFVARAATTDINVDGAEISAARWFTREQMKAEAEAGTLILPRGVSISSSLVETWYGGPLPGDG